MEVEETWLPDSAIGNHAKACVAGLKLLTNRCFAFGDSPNLKDVATPVFKLLWSLIRSEAEIKGLRHSAPVAARLRLQAAKSVLLLATLPACEKYIAPGFESLALLAQVSSIHDAGLCSKIVTLHLPGPGF